VGARFPSPQRKGTFEREILGNAQRFRKLIYSTLFARGQPGAVWPVLQLVVSSTDVKTLKRKKMVLKKFLINVKK